MNRFTCIGRFVHTPVEKFQTNTYGKKISYSNFKLAITDKYKKATTGELGKRVAFIDFQIFDSGCSVLCKNFQKGDPIYIEATVKTYRDKNDPSKNDIVFRVTHFEFLPLAKIRKNEVEEEVEDEYLEELEDEE